MLAATDKPEHYTIFLLPVGRWSDGSSGPEMK
jgi:hypothetical protein